MQSARRNCVDVWPYLTDVLRRIAAIAPGDTAALEVLLPDRWLVAHREHRLEQREEASLAAQRVAARSELIVVVLLLYRQFWSVGSRSQPLPRTPLAALDGQQVDLDVDGLPGFHSRQELLNVLGHDLVDLRPPPAAGLHAAD